MKLDTLLRELFEGETVNSLVLYNVNDDPLELNPGVTWAVDAGIEFTSAKGSFVFGWDEDQELIEARPGSLKDMSPELPARRYLPQHFGGLEAVVGATIKRIDCEIVQAEDFDGNPVETLLELRLHLSERTLRVACAELLDHGVELKESSYSVVDHLVITFDQSIRFVHPPDEPDDDQS